MGKNKIGGFVNKTKNMAVKHSSDILLGFGITGMISTVGLAVKATPKALKLIDVKKEELEVDELTPIETVKACWKPYVPAAVTCAFSVGCLIGSRSVNARRNAALATAYKLSETALSEYRDKVVEVVGEKQESIIRDKVNKERVEKNPVTTKEVIITERGNTLCYDAVSGRYFRSDMDKIKKAENELNRRMLQGEMYVSLNEFYDELDLDHTGMGDELGWNIDKPLDIYFSSQIADDGTPCIVVDYRNAPSYNYNKLY